MSFVPRFTAFLIHVAATGWLTTGLAPISSTTSACMTSITGFDTAPEPMPSSSAATLDAWQSRVQWSTLFEPKPVRTSFWKRYASSFEHFAEPNPARACGPCWSRIRASVPPARSSASSQLASRNTDSGLAGSAVKSPVLGNPGFLISGFVSRCGCET